MTRHITDLAVTTAIVLTLSACGSADRSQSAAETTSSSSVTTTSAPTESASATTETETLADREKRRAGEAVTAFLSRIEELAADPEASLTGLAEVADGQALMQWQRNLTLMRGEGVKQVGSMKVEDVEAILSESQTYQVSACIDVSKVNVVDRDGKSVVSADRQPRTRYTYEVEEIGGDFYVTKDSLKGESC